MAGPTVTATAPSDDEVKPYRVHVSSKYLELTKQKLELTRLPHEGSEPKSKDWWEPKPQVEPLIDYWLEHYSWREHEEHLNASLPQFRTAIRTANSETSVRIHLLHARSPHSNAVPLLILPPFPFTNLSLGHLIKPLTDPEDAAKTQPFHLVVPSLPGLGFSDALPNNTPMISTTAEILDGLMKRLEYPHYIATNASDGMVSPAEIDWKIASYLSKHYTKSCLGVHFISPSLVPPRFQDSFVDWTKWTAAKLFHAPILGYSRDDLSALQKTGSKSVGKKYPASSHTGLEYGGECEPNTLAYALCDSPTGLLLFIMKILRIMGAKKELSPEEIISLTALTWLPGPEAVLRFWAYAVSYTEPARTKSITKPKVGLTVFLGNQENEDGETREKDSVLPRPANNPYRCPRWANTQCTVVSSDRVSGKPGLLAWERPEVIANGARKLAKAILSVDKRMQASEHPGAALLEQVVVDGGRTAPADLSGTTVQDAADLPTSPGGKKVESPSHKPGADFLAPPEPLSKAQRSLQKPTSEDDSGDVTKPAGDAKSPNTLSPTNASASK